MQLYQPLTYRPEPLVLQVPSRSLPSSPFPSPYQIPHIHALSSQPTKLLPVHLLQLLGRVNFPRSPLRYYGCRITGLGPGFGTRKILVLLEPWPSREEAEVGIQVQGGQRDCGCEKRGLGE